MSSGLDLHPNTAYVIVEVDRTCGFIGKIVLLIGVLIGVVVAEGAFMVPSGDDVDVVVYGSAGQVDFVVLEFMYFCFGVDSF